jgi:hypothetical protein
MGKNHTHNQTHNWLQGIALRNLVRGRCRYRITLIPEDPKASPRIEVHTVVRKHFLLKPLLNKPPVESAAKKKGNNGTLLGRKNISQNKRSRIIFM